MFHLMEILLVGHAKTLTAFSGMCIIIIHVYHNYVEFTAVYL